MDVFRYMSPTFALETPEPENTVAVVEVPVMPVPEYHCALLPFEPWRATEYTGSEDDPSEKLNTVYYNIFG